MVQECAYTFVTALNLQPSYMNSSRSSLALKAVGHQADFANRLGGPKLGSSVHLRFRFLSYTLIFLAYTGCLVCWGRASLCNCSCAEKFYSDRWLITWVLQGPSGSPHLPASFCSAFRSHHTKQKVIVHLQGWTFSYSEYKSWNNHKVLKSYFTCFLSNLKLYDYTWLITGLM